MAEKIASKYNWTFHFKLVKGYNNATGKKIKNISKSIFLGGFPYPLSLSSFNFQSNKLCKVILTLCPNKLIILLLTGEIL